MRVAPDWLLFMMEKFPGQEIPLWTFNGGVGPMKSERLGAFKALLGVLTGAFLEEVL